MRVRMELGMPGQGPDARTPRTARVPEPGRRVRQRNRSRCGTHVPNLHTEHDKN
jgi:hypothetical protein